MAVFTPLDEAQIRDVLAAYDAGDYVRHEGILEGVENTNFHVFTTRGHLILTMFESRTNVADLPFFFAFTDHLVRLGVPCPGPLMNHEHRSSVLVRGKHVALFPFLEGTAFKVAEITVDHCADVGRFVARLHLAVADFKRERDNPLSLAGWKKLADKTRCEADHVQPDLAQMIDDELAWLSLHWPHALPRGAVHADIFPDNVFFRDDKVSALIDFYFSATDMLAYDLAIVINAWCFDQDYQFRSDCYRALMDGYQSIRLLSTAEEEAMPVLLRGAAVRFLMTRLHDFLFHDPENFVKPHDPVAFIERLKFFQSGTMVP